ncbi:uncharacterized protein LOC131653578 [Vicia villosa]|uniref:uncharacterized protein LOC131647041 n=1 Tax=Vicia villosa TaxID=3911 RepID=UPI00273A8F5A|nr:uncharacterized protein LOC131647041 [Vicia villosa]XP_058772951.1 uncharacterized protein LOC131647049 [Vicia villosa]XP_058778292.1 uncharacterized protein LOC131652458 [Vicia villosa]XP_058779750.1 uncharacterized protein LOC131653578 [Vicia villosa]
MSFPRVLPHHACAHANSCSRQKLISCIGSTAMHHLHINPHTIRISHLAYCSTIPKHVAKLPFTLIVKKKFQFPGRMSRKTDFVCDIDDSKEIWRLAVRNNDLWSVVNSKGFMLGSKMQSNGWKITVNESKLEIHLL